MANKKAYQEWEEAAVKVTEIARDKTIPLWQRSHLVSNPYTEIALEDLQSKHRRKILSGFGKINEILARYKPNLNTFDDYQIIEERDLREMIDIVKSLSPK
jgi:hypothetical protein